jgi:hypothetical protein
MNRRRNMSRRGRNMRRGSGNMSGRSLRGDIGRGSLRIFNGRKSGTSQRKGDKE